MGLARTDPEAFEQYREDIIDTNRDVHNIPPSIERRRPGAKVLSLSNETISGSPTGEWMSWTI